MPDGEAIFQILSIDIKLFCPLSDPVPNRSDVGSRVNGS
jgi:hypothetical protein